MFGIVWTITKSSSTPLTLKRFFTRVRSYVFGQIVFPSYCLFANRAGRRPSAWKAAHQKQHLKSVLIIDGNQAVPFLIIVYILLIMVTTHNRTLTILYCESAYGGKGLSCVYTTFHKSCKQAFSVPLRPLESQLLNTEEVQFSWL